MPQQTQAANKLLAHGWTEITSSAKTRRYRVFTKAGQEHKVFLGSAGAVRMGRTASDSLSMTIYAVDIIATL